MKKLLTKNYNFVEFYKASEDYLKIFKNFRNYRSMSPKSTISGDINFIKPCYSLFERCYIGLRFVERHYQTYINR